MAYFYFIAKWCITIATRHEYYFNQPKKIHTNAFSVAISRKSKNAGLKMHVHGMLRYSMTIVSRILEFSFHTMSDGTYNIVCNNTANLDVL